MSTPARVAIAAAVLLEIVVLGIWFWLVFGRGLYASW